MFRFHLQYSSVLILPLIFILGWTPDAQAYLDPGTSGMVLQLLMASVLGFIYTLKSYWGKFKDFFKSLIEKSSTNDYKN